MPTMLDSIDVSVIWTRHASWMITTVSITKETTPVVHYIFTQSFSTGELPTEWTQANVAPIFLKKGSK